MKKIIICLICLVSLSILAYADSKKLNENHFSAMVSSHIKHDSKSKYLIIIEYQLRTSTLEVSKKEYNSIKNKDTIRLKEKFGFFSGTSYGIFLD